MSWEKLESSDQFRGLVKESAENPLELIAVFKHSTRCPVSSMVKMQLQSKWEKKNPNTKVYLLNLIKYRSISDLIEEDLDVVHQSPQLIVLKGGEVVYHASHSAIDSNVEVNYR